MQTRTPRTRTSRNAVRMRSGLSAAAALVLTVTATGFQAVAAPAPAADVAAAPAAVSGSLVVQWNQQISQALSAESAALGRVTSPPVGARAFAIVHTAMYDAWAAYDAKAVGTVLGGELRRPAAERTEANKRAAVSYAAHRALSDLFPGQRATFDARLTALGYSPADLAAPVAGSPADVALTAADALLEKRADDGSNQHGTPPYATPEGYYTPVNAPQDGDAFDKAALTHPDRWVPLRVNGKVQQFATPHFATADPFVVKDPKKYLPPAPPAYGTNKAKRAIYHQILVNATLTERQKALAEHWQYPGSSSSSIPQEWAAHVSQRDGYTLDQDVKMFFALNLAEGEESVVAWLTKVSFDYGRPITMVRHAMSGKRIPGWAGPGKGTRIIDGEKWTPYLKTPAFAAYGSGHTGFTAVGAETLKLFTGSDRYGATGVIKAGSSAIEPGMPSKDVPLKWDTFSAAAHEVGQSRIYGGAHWYYDHDAAYQQGQGLARDVWKHTQAFFDATHTTAGQ
ncbi:hypothetical protein BJP40_19485 [Streptomyces sp. CC53]|uniref:vanadium-dependent haloperoxidase n=1 Tax=unclassified Streptomyces TaxID=2593676 RepID=UPI0008DCC454|nr:MULTISPECIES: vanadium-dependent haloperoxidase [unclassified Streptomyces]OII64779.1 hypothetical protein BJP40_19485 [Streptomyces sp. CC53]